MAQKTSSKNPITDLSKTLENPLLIQPAEKTTNAPSENNILSDKNPSKDNIPPEKDKTKDKTETKTKDQDKSKNTNQNNKNNPSDEHISLDNNKPISTPKSVKKNNVDIGAKRITESQHESIKRTIMKKEETNFDSIYFVPCSGNSGWYEIAEHSALIYYFEVVKTLKLKTPMHEDTMSFYTHYKYGLIRTNNPDYIKENVRRCNLLETISTDRDIITLKLNKSFTNEQIDGYWQQLNAERIKRASILEASNASPEFHLIISSLGKEALRSCASRMDKIHRKYLSETFISYIAEIDRLYLQSNYLNRKKVPERVKKKWEAIIEITYNAIVELQTMNDFGVWDEGLIARFGDKILRARAIARQEIAKLEKEIKNQQNRKSHKKEIKDQQNQDSNLDNK